MYIIILHCIVYVSLNIYCLHQIYHCNINSIGRICHSVLDRNYTSDISVKSILSCVYGLLMTPEPKDPLDG